MPQGVTMTDNWFGDVAITSNGSGPPLTLTVTGTDNLGLQIAVADGSTQSFLSASDATAGSGFTLNGNGNIVAINLSGRPFTLDFASVTTDGIKGWPALVGSNAGSPGDSEAKRVNATNQSSAIAAANLTNSCPVGYYIVHYTLEDTTADIAAGTIQFQINYADDIGATTQTGAALALTATGRDRSSLNVYLASGDIQYQTNLVGLIGTAKYALRVRVVFLG